jgi:hypothetical protein
MYLNLLAEIRSKTKFKKELPSELHILVRIAKVCAVWPNKYRVFTEESGDSKQMLNKLNLNLFS